MQLGRLAHLRTIQLFLGGHDRFQKEVLIWKERGLIPHFTIIRNRVSPSLYVRNENVHPWRVRTSRMNTRPIPCPFGLVEKKGLKIFASVSFVMPGPLSTTSIVQGAIVLLEKHGIQTDIFHLRVILLQKKNIPVGTHAFHKAFAHG